MKYKTYKKEQIEQVFNLFQKGMSKSEISKTTGIPRETLKSWLKKDRESIYKESKKYTIEQLKIAAKKVFSMSSLLRELNIKPAGGNYIHMRKVLQENEIDCSHWKGQGWNKDKQLKDWTQYTRVSQLKKHLILIRNHKCEICNLTEWLNYPITIEVHHIDGDRTNNSLENLQLLCCNCHATTDNWRNKKRVVLSEGLEPTLHNGIEA
jgi:transposase